MPGNSSVAADAFADLRDDGRAVDVRLLLQILAVALALWAVSWVAMVLLARRLPAGLLREAAGFLPACVTAARRLRGDEAVPLRAKVALLVAVLWVLSPIDLLPEFLPVIGPLDDVVVVVLMLRYAARAVPRPVLLEAWPAEPRLLELLLGSAPAPPTSHDGVEGAPAARRAGRRTSG